MLCNIRTHQARPLLADVWGSTTAYENGYDGTQAWQLYPTYTCVFSIALAACCLSTAEVSIFKAIPRLPIADGCGDLGAEAAGDGCLMADEQPPGLVDRRRHRVHVPRQQRPQIDDLARDAVSRGYLFSLQLHISLKLV